MNKELDYPMNLLEDIFTRSIETPYDIEGTVAYVLCRLTKRERDILKMRYEEKLSLRGCGERLGITSERVRQLITKTLHTLRQPYNSDILKVGADKYYTLKGEYSADNKIVLKTELKDNVDHILDKEIEYLALMNRSYKILRNAGIRTIRDLVSHNCKSLEELRFMGRTSFNNILYSLSQLGIKPEEDGTWTHKDTVDSKKNIKGENL